MQSDLKSDAFCIYNQSAAPLEWTLQKGQYYNTFPIGTVGISAASSFVRPDVINIDSFLSGRDDILSKCNPPIPALDEANEPPLTYQNQKNTNRLQPIYSKEKKSAVDLSAVSYLPLTLQPEQFNPPQDLNHIIFAGAAQRGGLNTSNLIKNSYYSDQCEYFLDPDRACGKQCSEVNGYFTRLPPTKDKPEAEWGKLPKGLPGPQWTAPRMTNTQIGKAAPPRRVTSQQVVAAGADNDGPQLVVPTQMTGPASDPRNEFRSHNKLPVISNPYNPPPVMSNPNTGMRYYSNKFSSLTPS